MKIFVDYPDHVLTNSSLGNEFENINLKRLEKKLGIYQRYVAEDRETAYDLAKKVCAKISSNELNKVDFLIYCTQTPEYFLPSTACILQNELGLKKTCGAFDFNLGNQSISTVEEHDELRFSITSGLINASW